MNLDENTSSKKASATLLERSTGFGVPDQGNRSGGLVVMHMSPMREVEGSNPASDNERWKFISLIPSSGTTYVK